jgi:hypothetical protein
MFGIVWIAVGLIIFFIPMFMGWKEVAENKDDELVKLFVIAITWPVLLFLIMICGFTYCIGYCFNHSYSWLTNQMAKFWNR